VKPVEPSGTKKYLEKNELETNSKSRNIRNLYRGINEFKKSCQSKTNLIKDENSDLIPTVY
jgi:hypothetical protein